MLSNKKRQDVLVKLAAKGSGAGLKTLVTKGLAKFRQRYPFQTGPKGAARNRALLERRAQEDLHWGRYQRGEDSLADWQKYRDSLSPLTKPPIRERFLTKIFPRIPS
jgi:hypothetical protein